MPEWTRERERGGLWVWRVVEEKMRGEPEGGRRGEKGREMERGGLMMNGWRTGMRDGAA